MVNLRRNGVVKSMHMVWLLAVLSVGCSGSSARTKYHDPNMDFSTVRSVAVMPFANLTADRMAAERVRDNFVNHLLATGTVYVIPSGEVARGIQRAEITNTAAPSTQDIAKLAALIKADAVITGVVREYGQVRSAATTANIISVSMQMYEAQTQRIVWTASATKGGITIWDRLFGGGGQPMNEVTDAAVNEIINKLFY